MLFRKHLFSYSPESKKCGFEGYFIQTKTHLTFDTFGHPPETRTAMAGAVGE